MHARKHDDVGIDMHGLARERQAVADDVGHGLEDLGSLIVVRQDDGVAFALEAEDGLDVLSVSGPFVRQDVAAHALVEVRQRKRCARDRKGIQHRRSPMLYLSITTSGKCRHDAGLDICY